MSVGAEATNRQVLVNVSWAGDVAAEISSVTIGGVSATRLHRLNGIDVENAELWAAAFPVGTTADVAVNWSAPVAHRHFSVYSVQMASLNVHTVASAGPGASGYSANGVVVDAGGFILGGTIGRTYDSAETDQFNPGQVFLWNASNQRSATGSSQMQSHVFAKDFNLASAASIDTSGPVPYYIVSFSGAPLIDPATLQTDVYSYPSTSNRLSQILEAGGHTRTFTHDAAGNVTYDNRSGGGYGYAYNAAGRMKDFSINGVVQAEYLYNALGQQVVRRLSQSGQTIHSVHDLDGNRIAEYDYDEALQISTLIREYVWMDDRPVAVVENDTLYSIRTDHIGRPVFATNDLGVKVWETIHLPFGGVHSSSAGNVDLRFVGQRFQSESGLHQNWMRDYDPTTGRNNQVDPLGVGPGPAVYSYAKNSPIKFVDPDGQNPILYAILKGGIKPAVKKLATKKLLKRGIACVGKARDHFKGLSCPVFCPKRVVGVGFTRGQAQKNAKLAALPTCRAFNGHFICKPVKSWLNK